MDILFFWHEKKPKRKNLKKISDDFKRQIAILTNEKEYISTPYKTFLNYIWKEFNAIEDSKKKKKSIFSKAKDFAKKVDKQIVKNVHTKSKKKRKEERKEMIEKQKNMELKENE